MMSSHNARTRHASPCETASLLTRAVLLTVALCLCAACAMRSPGTDYFVLALPEKAPTRVLDAHQALGQRLAIGPVFLPSYLDRMPIITRADNGVDIGVLEYKVWSEPLSDGFVRVLCDALNRQMTRGVALPNRAPFDPDKRLGLTINRFDGTPGGLSTLDVVWFLMDAEGKNVREGRFVEEAPSQHSVQSMVQTQARLIERFAQSLAPHL